MAIYHSDVTEDLGPLHIVSRQYTSNELLYPLGRRRKERPDLYEHEVAVVGPAGSLVISNIENFHRGSGFRATEGHRYVQFFVCGSRRHPWIGPMRSYAGLGETPELRSFLEQASPRGRELVGFPGVGDPYWNDRTIAGVAARYPGLDMSPYREAHSATADRGSR